MCESWESEEIMFIRAVHGFSAIILILTQTIFTIFSRFQRYFSDTLKRAYIERARGQQKYSPYSIANAITLELMVLLLVIIIVILCPNWAKVEYHPSSHPILGFSFPCFFISFSNIVSVELPQSKIEIATWTRFDNLFRCCKRTHTEREWKRAESCFRAWRVFTVCHFAKHCEHLRNAV